MKCKSQDLSGPADILSCSYPFGISLDFLFQDKSLCSVRLSLPASALLLTPASSFTLSVSPSSPNFLQPVSYLSFALSQLTCFYVGFALSPYIQPQCPPPHWLFLFQHHSPLFPSLSPRLLFLIRSGHTQPPPVPSEQPNTSVPLTLPEQGLILTNPTASVHPLISIPQP